MHPRNIERTPDGKLPAYAWPGGYTLLYLTASNDVLCSDCATRSLDDPEDFDPPTVVDIFWEGPDMTCEDCSKPIESSYGDPDDDTSGG